MFPLKDTYWHSCLSVIDFAFQPIVNIHTGVCYGYEALLRNYQAADFLSVDAFFDQAYHDNMLYPVELVLREKAIEKFSRLKWKHQTKLFINLDNRILSSGNYASGNTINILKHYGLSQDTICFEISEKHDLADTQDAMNILNIYRSQGFKIAVDDCGSGFSGLKLLYHTVPNFIKIDRFFIQDITNDAKKRLLVSSIVNIAHMIGGIVVAEGVETKQEYYSCRHIGCDLVQGYLVQHPETDMKNLRSVYEHIQQLNHNDRRKETSNDKKLIISQMEYIEPVLNKADIPEIFQKFRQKKNHSFFPVINENQEPLGVISEKSFKDYTFSRYGNELLQNPAFGKDLNRFITRYPIADINTPVEKILEIYSHTENLEGILIVDSMKYKGFLSAHSLLKVLNEKNIAVARDQNPLTRLPGNRLIYEYVSEALHNTSFQYAFVYFDFDNFKPYNDKYGFRHGDRIILLFADLLKAETRYANRFAGHIGGDDFFMGVQGIPLKTVHEDIARMIKQFQYEAESFYDAEAIEKSYILSRDRDGSTRAFPLLTVSAVILELPAMRASVYSTEQISRLIAKKKKVAKNCPEKISVVPAKDIEKYSLTHRLRLGNDAKINCSHVSDLSHMTTTGYAASADADYKNISAYQI